MAQLSSPRDSTPKAPPITVASRAQAEAALQNIALNSARLQKLAAALNTRLSVVRADCEPEILALNDLLLAEKAALELWAWAANGAGTEFTEKRSLDLSSGRVGFRAGGKSLGLLDRQTWDKVLAYLRTAAKGKWKAFIRTKLEVDKSGILKSAATFVDAPNHLSKEDLSAMGVKVEQEESFYVELKEN